MFPYKRINEGRRVKWIQFSYLQQQGIHTYVLMYYKVMWESNTTVFWMKWSNWEARDFFKKITQRTKKENGTGLSFFQKLNQNLSLSLSPPTKLLSFIPSFMQTRSLFLLFFFSSLFFADCIGTNTNTQSRQALTQNTYKQLTRRKNKIQF